MFSLNQCKTFGIGLNKTEAYSPRNKSFWNSFFNIKIVHSFIEARLFVSFDFFSDYEDCEFKFIFKF